MTRWNQGDDSHVAMSITAKAEAILAVFVTRSVFASERGEDQEDGEVKWVPDRTFLLALLARVVDRALAHLDVIQNRLRDQGHADEDASKAVDGDAGETLEGEADDTPGSDGA